MLLCGANVQHGPLKRCMRACSGWRYDPNYQISEYTFSDFDLTTMTNISSGDRRLWVHLVSCWVISLFVWRVGPPGCPSLSDAADYSDLRFVCSLGVLGEPAAALGGTCGDHAKMHTQQVSATMSCRCLLRLRHCSISCAGNAIESSWENWMQQFHHLSRRHRRSSVHAYNFWAG